jgi:uncharacterized protein (UPF0218 family)
MKLSEQLQSLAVWWVADLDGKLMPEELRSAMVHTSNVLYKELGTNTPYQDYKMEFTVGDEATFCLLEAEFQKDCDN